MELMVEELAGGVTRAALRGRLDIDGAALVDERLHTLAKASHWLVIDLEHVSFVASMGLRTLMLCARAMSVRGAKMALANAQPNVGRILEASGVDQMMTVEPSLEAALAGLR
jgi:anti-anti-sigma factor